MTHLENKIKLALKIEDPDLYFEKACEIYLLFQNLSFIDKYQFYYEITEFFNCKIIKNNHLYYFKKDQNRYCDILYLQVYFESNKIKLVNLDSKNYKDELKTIIFLVNGFSLVYEKHPLSIPRALTINFLDKTIKYQRYRFMKYPNIVNIYTFNEFVEFIEPNYFRKEKLKTILNMFK